MPDVGEGLTEAEILKWYVQPGDSVTDGQVVCEVETAKAAVELPIPYNGVVHELRFEEGTTVDVGASIITVDVAPGSGDPAPTAPAAGGLRAKAAEPSAEGTGPAAKAVSSEAPGEQPASTGTGRQPVLVGYGVAETSTKRRAPTGHFGRPSQATGRQPAARTTRRPPQRRFRRAERARGPAPRTGRSPSPRSANSRRTSGST